MGYASMGQDAKKFFDISRQISSIDDLKAAAKNNERLIAKESEELSGRLTRINDKAQDQKSDKIKQQPAQNQQLTPNQQQAPNQQPGQRLLAQAAVKPAAVSQSAVTAEGADNDTDVPVLKIDLSSQNILNAVIMSEVLGSPKCKRRGR